MSSPLTLSPSAEVDSRAWEQLNFAAVSTSLPALSPLPLSGVLGLDFRFSCQLVQQHGSSPP